MKFKKYILKSISMLLAFIMVFQQIPFSKIKAEAAFQIPEYRVLFYTDPFKSDHFNNITDISTIKDFPEHVIEAFNDAKSDINQKNKWYVLHNEDQLSYGEIHRRVQDDLWFRYEDAGILEGGELPIKYDKTTTAPDISIDGKDVSVSVPSNSAGRADIYRENDNETGLWEVKPPSYWTKNKINGILQLARYVYFGVDEAEKHIYEFGEIAASNTITGRSSSFNAYYVCTNFVTTWPETVTYNFNYTITEDSLIIYDFKRSEPVQGEHALSPAAANAFAAAAAKLSDMLKNKVPGGSSAPQPGYSYNYNPAYNPNTEHDYDSSTEPSLNPKLNPDFIDMDEESVLRLVEAGLVISEATKVVRYNLPRLKELYAKIKVMRDTWMAVDDESPSSKQICTILNTSCCAFGFIIDYSNNEDNEDYIEMSSSSLFEDILSSTLIITDPDDPDAIDYYLYDNNDEEDDLIKDIHDENDNYRAAGNAAPQRDPLAIDFGAKEINLTTLEEGVNFDLDNNGFKEKTAWIGIEDGFLALDVNGNGIIDNGSELFGDQFLRSNGKTSLFGYEALTDFDENDDNAITEEDSIFDQLRVWIDIGKRGECEQGELFTLRECGITNISLLYTEENIRDTETGTLKAESSSVSIIKNGVQDTTIMSEFWFDVDTTKTMHNGNVTSGNVPSCNEAIEADESGETAEIYMNFLFADDITVKRYYLKQFLYKITDSDNIASDSRGDNIDARDLHMIEQFMGRTFVGVDGENPNAPAAEILNKICNRIENIYYCILICQTKHEYRHLTNVIDINTNTLNTTALAKEIDLIRFYKCCSVEHYLYNLGVYLRVYDHRSNTQLFNDFKIYCNTFSDEYRAIVDIAGSEASTFIGTNDSNIINGYSNINYIFGQDESDILTGNNGNDVIYSGEGNDVLYGKNGNDTYVIEANHGNDVIHDTQGTNLVIFADYFTEDDYSLSVDANLGFVMTNKETGETVSVPDFLKNPISYKFSFGKTEAEFCNSATRDVINGTSNDDYIETGDGFNITYGVDGNDNLYGGKDIDFMYGGNGDDLLLGRNGVNVFFGEEDNDTIYDGDHGSYLNGGNGDDMLYGGGGADVLDGGAGNDYLQADHGNDTYVFGKGYDTDTINASSDLNTVIIHGYMSTDMINTRNAHNDLIINFKNSDDCLIIDHFFDYNSNRDFNFVFDDGTVLGQHDITAKYAPIDGTDADEWLAIQNSDDGIIHGNGGNDGVNGGSGNDELYGNSGDDTLYGNDGNDILDGGTGMDGLNGGNGTDTYIFAKGYGNDTINEWGSDHSIIKLTDINSDEVTVTDQYGSNLLLSIIDTEDTLVISNFKWGQATYTFEFADGAVATVNKDTWVFEFSQLPIVSEEEEVTTSDTTTTVIDETTVETEVFLEITEDEEVQSTEESDAAIETENTDSEVIVETENTTTNDLVDECDSTETEEVTEQTDSQEVDSAENVSEDITEETSSNIIDETEASVKTDMTE